MSGPFATKLQREADDMDRRLFDAAETAYANRWFDVTRALDQARGALLPRMHPEDRKKAANA